MAVDKNSIIVYADWIELFENLSDDEAGRLIKHFFRYVNDQNPEPPDRLTELAFIPIKTSLKRDLKKWEGTKEKRSIAGLASAAARKTAKEESEQNSTKSTSVESVEQNQQEATNPTVSVSVTVSDSVSVTDTVINTIKERKQKFASTLEPFQKLYPKQMLSDFYKYWGELNKSGTKFKQELEKTWDLERRLEMWARRDKDFNKNQPQSGPLSFSSKNMNR
jgi:hypothetical protein